MTERSMGQPDVTEETPTFAGSIQAMIQTILLQMFTAMPGTIQSYNPALGTVTVQPGIKRKYIKDDEVVNLPIINSVPVVFPRAGQAALTFPLKKGDECLLVFSQRSIERWKTQGGPVEAGDPRHHDMSDAFAIPGGYPFTKPLVGADPNNVVLQNGISSKVTLGTAKADISVGLAKMTMASGGFFTMGDGINEFLTLMGDTLVKISEILDNIQALTVPTGVGPSGEPINQLDFAADQLTIEELIVKLDSITG